MKRKPIALIGIGEMGGVFAKGFLKIGHPVYPFLRESDYKEQTDRLSDPLFVVLAVGEKDFHSIFKNLPDTWFDKLVLIQNELLPNDWHSKNVTDPTVISIWFEKKKGMDIKVILPSPIYGPNGNLLQQALGSLQIPTDILSTREELVIALVKKNLFVLTINIAGLLFDITVEELWNKHKKQTVTIAEEIFVIQEKMVQESLDYDFLLKEIQNAIAAAPDHRCRGRSAVDRLKRTLAHADKYELASPFLREIAIKHT